MYIRTKSGKVAISNPVYHRQFAADDDHQVSKEEWEKYLEPTGLFEKGGSPKKASKNVSQDETKPEPQPNLIGRIAKEES